MAETWKKLAFEDEVITKELLTATGDIIYASGVSTPAKLAVGSNTNVLTLAGGLPTWAAAGSPASHASTHQNGGGDEVAVTGLSGVLADDQHIIDAEAVTAMGVKGDSNPLHHDRYTDGEVTSLIGSTMPNNHAELHEDGGGDQMSVTNLHGVLANDQHIIDAEAVSAMGVKGDSNPLNHDKYTDAEAKTASVLAGAITNGETKAPTHDAVYDVKVTAEAAQTSAEVVSLIGSTAPQAHATSHKNAGSDEILLSELGEPTGPVDMNGQAANNFVFQSVADDTAKTALSQVVGMTVWQVDDQALYMCTAIV